MAVSQTSRGRRGVPAVLPPRPTVRSEPDENRQARRPRCPVPSTSRGRRRPGYRALGALARWHRPCLCGSSSPDATGRPAQHETRRVAALWRQHEEGQGLHPHRAHDRRRHHRHPRGDRDPELPPLPAPLQVQRAEDERGGDLQVGGVAPPERAPGLRERRHGRVRSMLGRPRPPRSRAAVGRRVVGGGGRPRRPRSSTGTSRAPPTAGTRSSAVDAPASAAPLLATATARRTSA